MIEKSLLLRNSSSFTSLPDPNASSKALAPINLQLKTTNR